MIKIGIVNTNQPAFNAKVSPRFVKSMQGYFNNGECRKQNIYRLNQKIEEYAAYGKDNYTVCMEQKTGALGYEYRLLAANDNNPAAKPILLAERNAYKKIVNKFMNMKKGEFLSYFRGIKD